MKYPEEVIAAAATIIDFYKREATYCFGTELGQALPVPQDLFLAVERCKAELTPAKLMELWNTKKDKRLPLCRILTGTRRKHAGARIKEHPRLEDWEKFLEAINHNDWCLGMKSNPNYPNWTAGFDWFIRPGSMVRFLEGGLAKNYTAPEDSNNEYGTLIDRRNEMMEEEKQ